MAFGAIPTQGAPVRIFLALMTGHAVKASRPGNAQHIHAFRIVAGVAFGGQMFFDQRLAFDFVPEYVLRTGPGLDPLINRVTGNAGGAVILRMFDRMTGGAGQPQALELRGTQGAATWLWRMAFNALDRGVPAIQMKL